MVKSYFRYEKRGSFGHSYTNQANVEVRPTDQALVIPSGSSLIFLDPLSGNLKEKHTFDKTSPISSIKLRETEFESLIAVGFSDGDILLKYFDEDEEIAKEKNASFTEHETKVTCLDFNPTGSVLASGGNDNLIVLWDMVSQAPLFKLTDQSQPVTCLRLIKLNLSNGSNAEYLLSGSKDGLLRVWDCSLQSCVQVFRTNRSEVTCIERLGAKNNGYGNISGEKELSFIVGTDSEDLIFVNFSDFGKDTDTKLRTYLKERGRFTRDYYSRVNQISYEPSNKLIFMLTDRRFVEVVGFRTKAEVQKKFKRRKKRAEKSGKEFEFTKEQFMGEIGNWVDPIARRKPQGKFDYLIFKKSLKTFENLVYLFKNDNSFELFSYQVQKQTPGTQTQQQQQSKFEFEALKDFSKIAHKNVIRAVTLSSDDSMAVSCSAESVKIWSLQGDFQRIKNYSMDSVMSCKFLPKDRYVLFGHKSGKISLLDLQSSEVIQEIPDAHEDTVWAIDVHEKPAGSQGIQIMTGSSDGFVKFWGLMISDKKLSLSLVHSQSTKEAIQWVKYAPNGKYYLMALLDNSIKMHFCDSNKLSISFYGHKMPVLCIDVSSDNTMLVSGSADKYVRIWGMDFGDSHGTLLAHEGSVTQVRVIRDTHYILSAGRDGFVRYWDGDTKQMIMEIEAHRGDIWAFAISSIGDLFVSAGADKVLKVYQQGKDLVYAQLEARDREEKNMVETYLKDTKDQEETATLGKRGIESLRNGEEIIEAILKAEKMKEDYMDYEEELLQWEKSGRSGSEPKKPEMQMMGQSTSLPEYVFRVISRTRTTNLRGSLKFLHFSHVEPLLLYIQYCLANNVYFELSIRVLSLVIATYEYKMFASAKMMAILKRIKKIIGYRMKERIGMVGYNVTALKYILKEMSYTKVEEFELPQLKDDEL